MTNILWSAKWLLCYSRSRDQMHANIITVALLVYVLQGMLSLSSGQNNEAATAATNRQPIVSSSLCKHIHSIHTFRYFPYCLGHTFCKKYHVSPRSSKLKRGVFDLLSCRSSSRPSSTDRFGSQGLATSHTFVICLIEVTKLYIDFYGTCFTKKIKLGSQSLKITYIYGICLHRLSNNSTLHLYAWLDFCWKTGLICRIAHFEASLCLRVLNLL